MLITYERQFNSVRGYVKWHKHDWTAAGFAGLVMGLAFLLIGFAYNDGGVALVGFIAFFGGLWLLRDK